MHGLRITERWTHIWYLGGSYRPGHDRVLHCHMRHCRIDSGTPSRLLILRLVNCRDSNIFFSFIKRTLLKPVHFRLNTQLFGAQRYICPLCNHLTAYLLHPCEQASYSNIQEWSKGMMQHAHSRWRGKGIHNPWFVIIGPPSSNEYLLLIRHSSLVRLLVFKTAKFDKSRTDLCPAYLWVSQ